MDGCGSDLASLDFNFECEDAIRCPLCDDYFDVTEDEQPLLQHLLNIHKFIIGDVQRVADLRQYILYWGKLRYLDLKDYCVVFSTNSEEGAIHPKETFYLLCSKMPEDEKLRSTLRQMKLKYIVAEKERERKDVSYSRRCIYCSETISGGVTNCFNHLKFHHKFNFGNPDNIVFGARLLDNLQGKFDKLMCLYCENIFTNHIALRQHIRKKQHRCLNPKNKSYDKFYLINYLRPGTPWEEAKCDQDNDSDAESIGDEKSDGTQDELMWTDWREDVTHPTTCLFCHFTTTKVPAGLFQHMTTHHNFDFESVIKDLTFYQQVKITNFIRSHMRDLQCLFCQESLSMHEDLIDHLEANNHLKLPEPCIWDDSQYLIPVIENDGLLCHLQDDEMDRQGGNCISSLEEKVIVPEDMSHFEDSILEDTQVREEITGNDIGEMDTAVLCLFCRYTASGYRAHDQVYLHMQALHCFDFEIISGISFYNQVKVINYIRWKTARSECYICGKKFHRTDTMEEHRALANHLTLPDPSVFRDRRWLRPVLENDRLLQNLKESEDVDELDEAVFSEDISMPTSILSDENVRQELIADMSAVREMLNNRMYNQS